MRRARQTSESVGLAAILALSGGLMDAYSYLARGEVFANAQTGNMLLFGVAVADGDWSRVPHYLLPVACFATGIALAQGVRLSSRGPLACLPHWRQAVLVLEACLLVLVAFLPTGLDLVANSLTSLACGIQVQAFRKLHGLPIATTMCIGNLRGGTQELVAYLRGRDVGHLELAMLYYGTIACFVLGAVIGSRVISVLALRAILVCPALLLVAFALMFHDRERHEGDGSANP